MLASSPSISGKSDEDKAEFNAKKRVFYEEDISLVGGFGRLSYLDLTVDSLPC